MFHLFRKSSAAKPNYIERIDEYPKLDIVRLKGRMDQSTIPEVEERIEANRHHGGQIDKNVLLDFAKVDHVDSATIAFHLVHLREYQAKGFTAGFINITEQLKALLDMFKTEGVFNIYSSEAEAVSVLNQ